MKKFITASIFLAISLIASEIMENVVLFEA